MFGVFGGRADFNADNGRNAPCSNFDAGMARRNLDFLQIQTLKLKFNTEIKKARHFDGLFFLRIKNINAFS